MRESVFAFNDSNVVVVAAVRYAPYLNAHEIQFTLGLCQCVQVVGFELRCPICVYVSECMFINRCESLSFNGWSTENGIQPFGWLSHRTGVPVDSSKWMYEAYVSKSLVIRFTRTPSLYVLVLVVIIVIARRCRRRCRLLLLLLFLLLPLLFRLSDTHISRSRARLYYISRLFFVWLSRIAFRSHFLFCVHCRRSSLIIVTHNIIIL